MSARRANIQKIVSSFFRLIITFIVIYVIRLTLLSLPGMTTSILSPITFAMVGNVVLGVLMIAVIIRFRLDVSRPLKDIRSPETITSVLLNLVYLAAIYVTYISFYPMIDNVSPDYVWVYSLILFLIAIYPIARISIAFYRSIDRLTGIISERLVRTRVGRERDEVDQKRCPECGTSLYPDAAFCKYCGAKVSV